MDGHVWTLLTGLGPILLVAVLVYAVVRNRKAGGRGKTEQATHDLYRAQDAQDKAAAEKVQR